MTTIIEGHLSIKNTLQYNEKFMYITAAGYPLSLKLCGP